MLLETMAFRELAWGDAGGPGNELMDRYDGGQRDHTAQLHDADQGRSDQILCSSGVSCHDRKGKVLYARDLLNRIHEPRRQVQQREDWQHLIR